jgi:hypothetical protein
MAVRQGPIKTPERDQIKLAAKKGSSRRGSAKGKYRSAKTGRYVTKKYGKSHKSTTVKESK